MTRASILRGIARLACSRPKLVLVVASVLTLLSLLPPFIMGITKYAFNVETMLPQEIPEARIFTRALVDYDSIDQAIVVFRLKDDSPGAIKQVGELAEAVAVKLRADKDIRNAFCKPLSEKEKEYFIRKALPRYGLLILPPEEIKKVANKLRPEWIRREIRKTSSDLNFMGKNPVMRERLLINALGIGDIFTHWIEKKTKRKDTGTQGYLVARVNGGRDEPSDGDDRNSKLNNSTLQLPNDPETKALLLLIIQPKQPAQRVAFAARIQKKIRRITEETLADMYGPQFAKTIRIEYGGGYAVSVAYKDGVNSVLSKTLLSSLIGVILLFGYCFRRYGVLIYIGIPLVMVVAWTVGVGWLIFGQLNLISCGFAAVLIGLGVDYAVHLYNRYVEERAGGKEVEAAFTESIEQTGGAIFVGMVTTCLAFLALKATRFDDLSQFGVLAGVGIALSVPAMLFVLPALVVLRNARSPEPVRVLAPSRFGLDILARVVVEHRKVILLASAILTLVCVGRLATQLDAKWFDSRLSSLRPKERAVELNGEIARAFSTRNPNKLQILSLAATEAAALNEAGRVQKGLEKLKAEGVIDTYESILSVLPSPEQQKERLVALGAIDFKKARRTLLAAIAAADEDPSEFQFNLKLLENHAKLVQDGGYVLPSEFADSPIGHLVNRFVTRRRRKYDVREAPPADSVFPLTLVKPAVNRKTQEVIYSAGTVLSKEQFLGLRGKLKRIVVANLGWTVKTNVYPHLRARAKSAEFEIDEAWVAKVSARLGLADPKDYSQNKQISGSYISGVGILAFALAKVIQEDLDKISLWVFIVATLALSIFYWHNPIRVVFCIFPIALGLLFLFGVMSFFSIRFNFLNILAIPIIIGLGVDNGIHLVNRFYEAERDVIPMIADTGRAIVITSLTSMIGFGSLVLGGYPGIASMGGLSILALATSLFASLVVFPALLASLVPPTRKNPVQDAAAPDLAAQNASQD